VSSRSSISLIHRALTHQGGHASGFKNSTEGDTYDTDGIALFHVRGSSALNTVAVQVAEVAGSLNSEDCFVLITPTSAFAWYDGSVH
jgi:3-deoxy-D-arabino-heptulosonate 7-phosphate (DAHP) synthase